MYVGMCHGNVWAVGCSGQTKITSTCTGVTSQKAGIRYSCQAAAFGGIKAIRSIWQRRKRTFMNISEGLKIYLLLAQTNRVRVCVSDVATLSAADYCDVVKRTHMYTKVSHTQHLHEWLSMCILWFCILLWKLQRHKSSMSASHLLWCGPKFIISNSARQR